MSLAFSAWSHLSHQWANSSFFSALYTHMWTRHISSNFLPCWLSVS